MASGNTVDVKSRLGEDVRRFTVQRDLEDYQVSAGWSLQFERVPAVGYLEITQLPRIVNTRVCTAAELWTMPCVYSSGHGGPCRVCTAVDLSRKEWTPLR